MGSGMDSGPVRGHIRLVALLHLHLEQEAFRHGRALQHISRGHRAKDGTPLGLIMRNHHSTMRIMCTGNWI